MDKAYNRYVRKNEAAPLLLQSRSDEEEEIQPVVEGQPSAEQPLLLPDIIQSTQDVSRTHEFDMPDLTENRMSLQQEIEEMSLQQEIEDMKQDHASLNSRVLDLTTKIQCSETRVNSSLSSLQQIISQVANEMPALYSKIDAMESKFNATMANIDADIDSKIKKAVGEAVRKAVGEAVREAVGAYVNTQLSPYLNEKLQAMKDIADNMTQSNMKREEGNPSQDQNSLGVSALATVVSEQRKEIDNIKNALECDKGVFSLLQKLVSAVCEH
jgi:hypothetical protein